MWTRSRLRQKLLPAVAAVVLCLGCTIDDPQVSRVGAVSLLTLDPAIGPQSVALEPGGIGSGNRAQATLWTITHAQLFIGNDQYDLTFTPAKMQDPSTPADCQGIDPIGRITTHFGTCVENIVLEAVAPGGMIQATLELNFKVRVKRVRPITLPYIGDEDSDGVLNGNDNCILVPNGNCSIDPLRCDVNGDGMTSSQELSRGNQRDSGNLGIGNACRVVNFITGVELDSDADGVPDVDDNCVHRINPDQANPPTPGEFSMVESRISDGIGLACEDNSMNPTPYKEQIIEIDRLDPMNPVVVNFDFDLPAAQGFVLVDFNNDRVFTNCDWIAGTCTLDPGSIRACIRTSIFDAVLGCG